LGNVDNLEAFYEYQLYCKNLHISISKLINQTRLLCSRLSSDNYISQIFNDSRFIIQDRRQEYIITIDPKQSLDFDDGFSITPSINGTYKISVYIANVYFWLEILELWAYMSDRISTIYLPDTRRTMLPTILSDELCSLQEKQNRFAFTMDLIVDANGHILEEPQYCNSIINVSKNYCYDESKLLKDLHYIHLFDMTQKIMANRDDAGDMNDSHDLVAFWMVQMNKSCSEYMIRHKFGIFRATQSRALIKAIPMSDSLIKAQQGNPLIKAQHNYWNNVSGQYILYSKNHQELEHTIMNMKSYIHITSPIRRLVDLLNQMSMMQHLGIITELSSDASTFLLKWIQNIDYINTTTKSIRKVQTECELLTKCIQDPDIIGQIFDGIVFDVTVKPDGRYTYTIYLESLKMLSTITTSHCLNDSIYQFKLYLFQDEYNSKKKIRLQLQDSI